MKFWSGFLNRKVIAKAKPVAIQLFVALIKKLDCHRLRLRNTLPVFRLHNGFIPCTTFASEINHYSIYIDKAAQGTHFTFSNTGFNCLPHHQRYLYQKN